MSTIDDLMALAEKYGADYARFIAGEEGDSHANLRAALEAALAAEYERGRRQRISEQAQYYASAERTEGAEPVAWALTYRGFFTQHFQIESAARQELARLNASYRSDAAFRAVVPLYTAPPKRKPLAADRIESDASEIERLRAELDALRADAERYRWLQNTGATIHRTVRPGENREHVEVDAGAWTRRATLDEVVDAAMATESSQPQSKENYETTDPLPAPAPDRRQFRKG